MYRLAEASAVAVFDPGVTDEALDKHFSDRVEDLNEATLKDLETIDQATEILWDVAERRQVMDTTPVLTVADDPPFVDRVADKMRTLAAVKPALVRLLEWQIDQALAMSQCRLAYER